MASKDLHQKRESGLSLRQCATVASVPTPRDCGLNHTFHRRGSRLDYQEVHTDSRYILCPYLSYVLLIEANGLSTQLRPGGRSAAFLQPVH